MTEQFDRMPRRNMTYAEVIAYEHVLAERDKALAIARVASALEKVPTQLAAIARRIR